MANRKALGRGLSALIPDAPQESPAVPSKSENLNIRYVQVSSITPNPFQPRLSFDPEKLSELKNSIAENGVVQPVTVRKYKDGYQLIAGERRLRAVTDLGHEEIPAFILDVTTDEEMLELSIIENIHREDLNSIDIAKSYKRLMDECGLTQEKVAQKVGKDRATVTNFLRLLKLPRQIQDSAERNEISMGHARALLSVSTKGDQLELWKQVMKQGLSVRKTEQMAQSFGSPKNEKKTAVEQKQNAFLMDAENKLRNKLTTKVSVKIKSKGGNIVIDYFDDDDFDRLVSLICEG